MEKTYSGPERRTNQRLRVNFIVIYEVRKPLRIIMLINNREINALMMDLSESGMALLTDYDLPRESTLLIKFTLINIYAEKANRVKTMEIVGEVRNNVFLGREGYRVGVCFTQIVDDEKEAISNFVKFASSH